MQCLANIITKSNVPFIGIIDFDKSFSASWLFNRKPNYPSISLNKMIQQVSLSSYIKNLASNRIISLGPTPFLTRELLSSLGQKRIFKQNYCKLTNFPPEISRMFKIFTDLIPQFSMPIWFHDFSKQKSNISQLWKKTRQMKTGVLFGFISVY